MSSFKYKDFEFNFTTYREFVNEYNIFNNQRASAENLNKSANQLKKELNLLVGLFKVITSKEALRWDASINYTPGEVVSFITKPNPTPEEIKDSYYMALPNNYDNIGYYPDKNSDFWLKVTLNDIYPWLTTENYPLMNGNLEDWEITGDYDVVNLKHLNKSIANFKEFLDEYLPGIYLKIDNETEVEVTEPNHMTTKKYVDEEIQIVKDGVGSITQKLMDYLFIEPSTKKLKTLNEYTGYIQTTNAGFTPGTPLESTIGTDNQQFRAMYARDFIGTALRAKYADLAEIYKTNKTFEVGSVLGIDSEGIISEFDILKHKRPLGVVSNKPGFILNSDESGVIIALKGQTLVKVSGKAEIGDELYAEYDGTATANPRNESTKQEKYFIGIALESKDSSGLGLINAKV